MKEDFLHYLWKFKKFDTSNLQTSNHESISILHPGHYLQMAGPDFFNAQLVIGEQQWAGNVEIHVNASDWYLHHHEKDEAYDNVILHVVWKHDAEIFRKDNSEIPVLELSRYVANETLDNYQSLKQPKSWIYCEKQLTEIDPFLFGHWQERLFFERLDKKSMTIETLLNQTHCDWEAVLFGLLAKNFGLNTNGDLFLKMAVDIPFVVIRKESHQLQNIEALLFGLSGLLDLEKEDQYYKNLKSRFQYLSQKYNVEKTVVDTLQFFKLRPDNFPTIRLSQLANLYASRQNLFSEVVESVSVIMLYQIFGVAVSEYWQTHYQFDKMSPKKTKLLSKAFIDLIIVNTIVPVQFAYAKSQGKEPAESIIQLMRQLSPESNSVIDKFTSFGVKSENALQTQSLLQLKNEYCAKSRCLECAVGIELLKSNTIKV